MFAHLTLFYYLKALELIKQSASYNKEVGWKKWGMNGTIISGEECSSRGNSEYADPEEKHIWLSQARNQYAHSTLSNSEMIEQCRLYVGLCRP